jgi:hypothetical protein
VYRVLVIPAEPHDEVHTFDFVGRQRHGDSRPRLPEEDFEEGDQ